MGLAHRVIPVLLARDGNLVKGKKFDSSRVVGNVQQAAEIHQARGVDELLILDVGATPAGRGPDFTAMARLTERCFMPVSVGGGVSEVWHVRELLANGADKVVIGAAARGSPGLIQQCTTRFGGQAIVVAIHLRGWHGELAAQFARHITRVAGAGEILITSVQRDGTLRGYDIPVVRAVAAAVDVPVIANGGAGSYLHMHHALAAGASAVAAGAMFQWLDLTPLGAAEYLARRGWEVRL